MSKPGKPVDAEEAAEQKAFAVRLNYAMGRKDMKEADLERAAGMGTRKRQISADGRESEVFRGSGHVNRLLNCERGVPGPAIMKRLAAALGVRPAWLAYDEPPMDASSPPVAAFAPPPPTQPDEAPRKRSGVHARRKPPSKSTGAK
jgi:hypothetical protein